MFQILRRPRFYFIAFHWALWADRFLTEGARFDGSGVALQQKGVRERDGNKNT